MSGVSTNSPGPRSPKEDSFFRLLDTRYDPEREQEALDLLEEYPELGADVDAARAPWYRSVLAWSANNARAFAEQSGHQAAVDFLREWEAKAGRRPAR